MSVCTVDFKKLSDKTGVPGVNRNDAHRLKVYLPPLPEQQKIAQILSTWDRAIDTLDTLIAAKQKRKTALMQQLLTGKRRLPGFDGKFKKYQFQQLVKQYLDYRGRTPLKIGMGWGNGDIKALSANNVQMGYIDFKKECYFGSNELYKKWMTNGDCKKGDVILTTEAPLGNVAQIPNDSNYILSQRVILVKTRDEIVNKNYLFHLATSHIFQNELMRNSEVVPIVKTNFVSNQVKCANCLKRYLCSFDLLIE